MATTPIYSITLPTPGADNDTWGTTLNSAITSLENSVTSASVLKTGSTMTGPLVLSAAPTATLGAATKGYADTGDAARLPLTGGTLTGALAGTTASFSGAMTIRNTSPTFYFQDTDNKGGAIHCNSDLVYIISCPVDSQTFSTPPNGRWPFYASTSTGDITLGRNVDAAGGTVTANVLTAPDTRGGIFQSQSGSQATIKTPWGSVQFHWDGNAFHFAADGGNWQRLARSSNISYHDIRQWGDPWAILHSDGGNNFICFVDVISSDIRFKENVAATKVDSLKYITALSLIEFDWNADGIAARNAPGGRVDLGVVAQEIAQFCPEAVPLGPMTLADGSERDRHRIRYELMTPHLIRSIQQQQERIEQHEAKIQQQAALIANLADRLTTLEGAGA